MRRNQLNPASSGETLVRNIRRATRKHHAAEREIRIVLDGLRGETSIAELCACRRHRRAYSWSKEFLGLASAGSRRHGAGRDDR